MEGQEKTSDDLVERAREWLASSTSTPHPYTVIDGCELTDLLADFARRELARERKRVANEIADYLQHGCLPASDYVRAIRQKYGE